MLTFEQIKELIELVAQNQLRGLEVERSGFRLKIDGQQTALAAAHSVDAAGAGTALPVAAAAPPSLAAATPAAPAAGQAASGLPAGTHVLTSPIVGTFYAAPSPDAEPFVRVGDRVRVGQVLCIVEAMKLMNEIESDVAGTVLQVYPKNAQPVEYGEPLFAIRPD